MRVVFLFPGSGPYEALDNWVLTLGRHTRHEVYLSRKAENCAGFDCAFALTEARTYPRAAIDADLAVLAQAGVKYAVLHNNDSPGGVPTPGHYPSFCWTKRGQERLGDYAPILLRQPVFPAIKSRLLQPLKIGTFGHIEAKKQTFEMARWAKKHQIPFVAAAPVILADEYELYISDIRNSGCGLRFHPWLQQIEELGCIIDDCSHFLFVLTDSKKGTGGSPTSPRFASMFNRPVIVIDDEDTFREDGYYVYEKLADLKPEDLKPMTAPDYGWSPDAYLDALCYYTREFWRKA